MTRQALTDGSGRYFAVDAASSFDEATRWNGNNHISLATGSQWEHERLYRTRGGRWILHSWSQWQGSDESWEGIDDERAARWMSINGHDPHRACAAEFAALEIE